VSISGSVASCFRNYATFSGRAGRPEFWWFTLFVLIVAVGLILVERLIWQHQQVGWLVLIWTLITLLPHLAVGCRRLHDCGRTGWLQLLLIILCIGTVILIFFWVQRGSDAENAYGPAVT
jgi:uncharacterized membrane protein YhaH (DUF805 family)